MIEDFNGTYKQSSSTTFPGYEYFYNQTKSGCMSSSGKQIEDSLLYDQENKKVTVNVGESSMCYLYFDKYKTDLSNSTTDENGLLERAMLYQTNIDGDGYRYVGSGTVGSTNNPDNFICFGTTDVSECTGNINKYMYRIIGIFYDSNGNKHIKLIKYKQLGKYAWNADSETDISWENSELYKGLNGNYFLTNTEYDYMQDTTWLNKIEDWTWSAVNTNSYDNYGDTTNSDYSSSFISGIYLHELQRGSLYSQCENLNGDPTSCNDGEWTNPVAKIGLMYASDYGLSLGSSSLSLTGSSSSTLKTGWMHPNSNDTTQNTNEWTMSRFGYIEDEGYFSWAVDTSGYIDIINTNDEYGVRPTFYLTTDTKIGYGNGSLNSPFIISNELNDSSSLKITLSNVKNKLTAKITKGTGNLSKYCINSSVSISNCTWKIVTSTSIDITMSGGTYYIHVIDDLGYIAHASYTYIYTFADELIDSGNLWQSGLKNDGYRYVGSGAVGSDTNPNNFVCFGTTDKTECTANQDKYMYRIIGVFDRSVKLIKYKQLSKSYMYYLVQGPEEITYENSYVGVAINHSGFLTNTDYDYLQNNAWLSKIQNWTWINVNTQTYSNSGLDYNSYNSGLTPSQIYNHEICKTGSSIGIWNTSNQKIGLMYASDFVLSISEFQFGYHDLSDSWIHPNNNDTTQSTQEWTIAVTGKDSGPNQGVWTIGGSWYLSVFDARNNELPVRPTFYLTKSTKLTSGDGSLENPYMIN